MKSITNPGYLKITTKLEKNFNSILSIIKFTIPEQCFVFFFGFRSRTPKAIIKKERNKTVNYYVDGWQDTKVFLPFSWVETLSTSHTLKIN